ncbi:hypothetical protein PR048_018803 [Dryococelus australis]|uniref:PiggyBac transposable element-derived protein domain-containing protein n=1 Tax=Dryococelus australis TaxID=614101 RepID=A0ABQ9H209_9NEOP|nr:hypothetical protein PR048_018803 [Dryococelus australis]
MKSQIILCDCTQTNLLSSQQCGTDLLIIALYATSQGYSLLLMSSCFQARSTQYIVSKPDKFGQKYWLAVEKDSKYLVNCLPYVGKDDSRLSDDHVKFTGERKKRMLLFSAHYTQMLRSTVECYNDTKYGVDILDQMARKYAVRISTRRWPMHTFQNILDLAAINAWILYKEITSEKISYRCFLQKFVEELAESNIQAINLRSLTSGLNEESDQDTQQ